MGAGLKASAGAARLRAWCLSCSVKADEELAARFLAWALWWWSWRYSPSCSAGPVSSHPSQSRSSARLSSGEASAHCLPGRPVVRSRPEAFGCFYFPPSLLRNDTGNISASRAPSKAAMLLLSRPAFRAPRRREHKPLTCTAKKWSRELLLPGTGCSPARWGSRLPPLLRRLLRAEQAGEQVEVPSLPSEHPARVMFAPGGTGNAGFAARSQSLRFAGGLCCRQRSGPGASFLYPRRCPNGWQRARRKEEEGWFLFFLSLQCG